MSVQHPPWHPPTRQVEEPVLKMYNSLTKTKTEFIPKNGHLVKWYNCGPTVYDASHMGHARNYVTQDILRRILSDYFGYDIHFVMNITDIDDKIILRARQNHLFETFRNHTISLTPELVAKVQDAWQSHVLDKVSKGLPESIKPTAENLHAVWPQIEALRDDKVQKAGCLKRDEKFEMNLGSAIRTASALSAARQGQTDKESALTLLDESRDIIAASLDKELKHMVSDPSIFRGLAAFWEDQFFQDMDRLRVRRPDTLTRVTEYVPEIVEFVKRVMKNGYAYEHEGSVYFDTVVFDSSENHTYAKLEPWSKGNRELLAEGEGALSITAGKRSISDFALWKASKAGEPSWPSPWGSGRPGWHIECSVMASAIFGDNIDIHSGGIDLAFPHHDNEMAQSEAYHECSAWVNYFIHTGHLHIEGLKMSKSLKNFITIDDILQKFTPRQLRLAFLTQLWNAKVDFSDSLMTGEVKTIETTFNNFFVTVKALLLANEGKSDGYHHYEDPEREVLNAINESKLAFRAALCDSFNTPEALRILRELISRTNVYISTRTKSINIALVEQSARWIGNMLRMFGLGEGEKLELGWGQETTSDANAANAKFLLPYLRALSSFRDGVRQLAIAKRDDSLKEILKLCDRLRDEDLVPLGVALDDQEDGKALVKLVPASELIRARDEKRQKLEAQAARKAELKRAAEEQRLVKLARGRTPPEELFKPPNVPEGTYSQWNEQGIPVADGEGGKLSKSQEKKILKQWTEQKKLHEEYLAWQQQQQQ
ncbi:cysteinyl-tRNA synthetase [Boletus edulis BED1]|uniref:cysteine--tRNA ligase n=1 Tax=Boletus edulis BED1 TaxID=1328754 RepID=A0AAD4C1F9_BOLED|nr:cysteinyl-tRNA synthetase [Boletus edulis BED1]